MISISTFDHTLIFFICFLSMILIIRKSLNVLLAFGALVCACLFILADGHYVIASWVLPQDKNPQIATVILSILVTLCLALRCVKKSWRSLDRIMILIASCSVLATGLAFHVVLVQTILPAWAKDAAWANSYLVSIPPERFKAACEEARLECWVGNDLLAGEIDKDYKQQILGIYQFYADHLPEGVIAHGIGAFNDLGQDSVAAILYHQDGSDIRVIADSAGGTKVHSAIRDAFYFLSSIAHSVWIFGALILLGFHKVRFKMRGRK